VPTSRLEAFSDGVFAVAATLLVLDLHVPLVGSGALWPQIVAQWPSFVAYLVSFLTIGIIWVNHHALFGLISRVDRPLLFLNLLLLLTVSLLPFPTAIAGEWVLDEEQAPVAAVLLGCTFLLMGIAFSGIWLYALLHHDLTRPGLELASPRNALPRFTIGNLAYAIGIGLAFVSPLASLLVYGLVAVYYVFPTLPHTTHPRQGSA
jgi:uncharacterized membrane protein